MGIPIEQAVNGVEGAIYMSSTSASDGSYSLTVTFNVGTDLNTSLSLVQNYVNSALAQLPSGVSNQGITVKKVSTDIVLVVSISSKDDRYDANYLSNYAIINLENPLARLPGVGQVIIKGSGPYSMRVWLDPRKLQDFNLTTLDVVSAIQGQNVQVVAGKMGGPPTPPNQVFQFTVNALGRLSDVEQFEDIIVKSPRGAEQAQIVRVRDVARVELSQQTYSTFAEVNGHPAADIPVFLLPGANAMTVAQEVKQAMAEMSKRFPPGMIWESHYDTTKFVAETIQDVYMTLFLAGILVLIVIMVFLQNWRATLVPATTVPVTIIGAFAAMLALGFSINLMTLFALILAIGIVVDDAIVIVESASYHIEQGLPPKEATIKAMEELTGPVFGITLALVSVFLPAAFLPGITGQIFRQFALVIAATSIISAINALTLKPAQCALWLRPRPEKKPNLFFGALTGLIEHGECLRRLVSRMVHRPVLTLLVFLVIIASSRLAVCPSPYRVFTQDDQGYAIVITKLPDAASQPRVMAVVKQINEILKQTKGIAAWVTFGGYSALDAANVSNISHHFHCVRGLEQARAPH